MAIEAYRDNAGGIHVFQLGEAGRVEWSAGYAGERDAACDYAQIINGVVPSDEGWDRCRHDDMEDADLLRGELAEGPAELIAEGATFLDKAFERAVRAAQRTHADFRMAREELGLSQADVADALGVAQRTVRRWESPDEIPAPAFAWEWIGNMRETFAGAVAAFAGSLEGMPDGERLRVAYYRSQKEYDEAGQGKCYYGMVNAAAREVAKAARDKGMDVQAMFPDERPGSTGAAKVRMRG